MQATRTELQELLEETKPRLLAIPEAHAFEKPFADKWSLKEILGHLIDSAANNHQRIVRMQERPDIGAFTYSQQHWVTSQQYQQRSWADIVELWYQFNRHLAHVIGHIDPASLAHTCDMGYAAPATLKLVAEDYVRHVRHHVEQILSGADPRQRKKWVARNPRE
jgi:hypothetical protein